MKKNYTKPEFKEILLPCEDVLTTSGNGDGIGNDIWPDGGLDL